MIEKKDNGSIVFTVPCLRLWRKLRAGPFVVTFRFASRMLCKFSSLGLGHHRANIVLSDSSKADSPNVVVYFKMTTYAYRNLMVNKVSCMEGVFSFDKNHLSAEQAAQPTPVFHFHPRFPP